MSAPTAALHLQLDVLPHVVNEQWATQRTASSANGEMQSRLYSSISLPELKLPSICEQTARYIDNLVLPSGPKLHDAPPAGSFCAVYLADHGILCRRINTLQNYLAVNRELAQTDAGAQTATVWLACGVMCTLDPGLTRIGAHLPRVLLNDTSARHELRTALQRGDAVQTSRPWHRKRRCTRLWSWAIRRSLRPAALWARAAASATSLPSSDR